MKKLTLIGVLVSLCLVARPAPPDVKPLSVGDIVPDIVINNLVNYKDTKAKLSDFKDKLLILDFMNTACIACIEALPELNNLHKDFEGRLLMMLVTPEENSRVLHFQENNPYGKQNKLAFATADSVLSSFFPHVYIPHIVWINKGRVVAITYPEYVTKANIEKIISGQTPVWPLKHEITTFDPNLPLITLNGTHIPEVSRPQKTWYSILTTHLSGIPKTYQKVYDSSRNVLTVRFLNYGIIDLYLLAFQKPVYGFPKGRIILQVRDTNRFVFNPDGNFQQQWITDNTYAYEAVMPVTHADERQMIKDELDRFFNLSGEIRQMRLPCIVLEKISLTEPFSLKMRDTNALQPVTIKNLISILSGQRYGLVAINESGLPDSSTVHLSPASYTDRDKMNEELLACGLTLAIRDRVTEVLFIKEKF